MSLFIKVLIVLGILYYGYRMATKPFRQYMQQVRKQQKMGNTAQKQEPKQSKTDNIGEYIDYEEVDE